MEYRKGKKGDGQIRHEGIEGKATKKGCTLRREAIIRQLGLIL